MKFLRFLPFFALPIVIAGCKTQTGGNTTAAGNTTATGDTNAITIISPHTSEIKAEFKKAFEAKNPDLQVTWQDQGGTADILGYVRNQYASKPKDEGIGVDLFFGGGGETFAELEQDGFLQPLDSDYKIPAALNGVPLVGKDKTWVAAALSGFGILYNKNIAARDKLPLPQSWADMANPALQDRIEMVDPRHSGSAHTTYEIILQSNGWEKGWKILTAMAGNSRKFVRGSSEPLQDVQNGEAVFAPAIDFYARNTIERAGADKLGYIEPKGQYVITADPIGLMKGASHSQNAKKFVDFVMSPEGQKLWYLPKGAEGGPKQDSLMRIPALPAVFNPIPKNALIQTNPYNNKNEAKYDADTASIRRRALDDLIGSVLVDNHGAIQKAWKKNPSLEATGFVPISEAELMKIAPQWDDPKVVAKTKSAWAEAARKKFGN